MHPRQRSWLPFAFAWRAALALLWVTPALAQGAQLEYAVKATYLYKFAPFVEWPVGAAGGPFRICVFGADPFGPVLDDAVRGQSVGDRSIEVRRLASAAGASECRVLFVAGADPLVVQPALAAVRGLPVLTVTEVDTDGGPKGIVNFVRRERNVRFEVDAVQASDSRLAISSKLLSLATSVRQRR